MLRQLPTDTTSDRPRRVSAPRMGVLSVPRWTLLVPVKDLGHAKSRLVPPHGVDRSELAHAFAEDTLAAAVSCAAVAEVRLVSDDPTLAVVARALGAHVMPGGPDGLNPALVHAVAGLLSDGPVAVITGDLPALRPRDLETALRAAETSARSAVADTSGRGTTMLAAAARADFQPSFGEQSFARHLALGARAVDGPASLRADVDTAADLALAEQLGLGPATTALLAHRRLG